MANHIVKILKRPLSSYRVGFRFISYSDKLEPKSSLFISGERAQDTFVSVIPHLDFAKRFQDLQQLEENMKKRRLHFNVVELKESWEFYKDWNEKKVQMQENFKLAIKQMNDLNKMDDSERKLNEMKRLDIYINVVKDELNDVKKNVWSMEESVVRDLLKLPNELHPDTPENELDMFVYDKEDYTKRLDQISIGEKLGCLEYHNNLTCYLKNKAALFELAVPELFIKVFSKKDFIRFSNPDFTRSVLAEGVCATINDHSELFLLEQSENNHDHLHLCGGASLFPFCGFHARHSVPKQFLPVKYIATGRRFNPSPKSLPGLYSINQSTSVELFIAAMSDEEMYSQFQSCVNQLREIYIDLGLNFKFVKKPPKSLKKWESLRVTIEVFSPIHKTFVEVGNISLVGDFISKRLRMCYTDKNEERFLHVVSGSVVNVQTLLALCLERSGSQLSIPDSVFCGQLLRW